MNEQAARDLVLVRAIEQADPAHEVLSADDRQYASRAAREHAAWSASERGSSPTEEQFLCHRAGLVVSKLSERYPAFDHVARPRLPFAWLSIVIPFGAFLLGAGIDHIANPHRVDLLSLPLLLIIAWNLLSYLLLLLWSVTRRNRGALGQKIFQPRRVKGRMPDAMRLGVLSFFAEWPRLSAPLTAARVARIFHLGAAMVGIGVVISLYVRGLLVEYGAGWESTFLDERDVHQLLSWLFWPAQALFGLESFTLQEIAALRGTPAAGAGARWVHLYAATLALVVIVPRLLLALGYGVRAAWLARHFPIDLADPAFQRMSGVSGTLLAVPYSISLDAERSAGLARLAVALLGEGSGVRTAPPVSYGASLPPLDDVKVNLVAGLFSMAATPELENHGEFIEQLLRRSSRKVLILLDESDFVSRAATPERMQQRATLWREFCARYGAETRIVNLIEGAVR